MKYILRFVPEVEEDVVAGYEWYEKKARGLGWAKIFYFASKPHSHKFSTTHSNTLYIHKEVREVLARL